MNFDHNKYFSNALKTIIAPELKKHGFTKRGTLTFVRRTKDDVIQVINFQKSKWGNKAFYVNVRNLTLHKKVTKFFAEVGHRIGQLDNTINTGFNFQIPILGDISLKDIRTSLIETVIPFLNYTTSLKRLHRLSLFARDNSETYPFLKIFGYPELKKLGVDEAQAFRHLCLKEYDKALEIYSCIESSRLKYNPETKEYKSYKTDPYRDIINKLEKKEYEAISSDIQGNIQSSLIATKFDKLKIRETPETNLKDVISTLSPKEGIKHPRSSFPAYHYKIYSHKDSKDIYHAIKAIIGDKYELTERENELVIQVNEKHSFYLAINNAEYVQNENEQIISEYKGSKDVSWISLKNNRVEFWSDEDKNMDFFNEHLFLLGSINKMEIEILHGELYGDIFFDED